MLSRIGFPVLMLGIALAGPAAADEQPAHHPAASIDIATLTAESDFAVFMHKDVPEDVRRRALRKLWKLIELPNECLELCYEPAPAVSTVAHAASGERHARMQHDRP